MNPVTKSQGAVTYLNVHGSTATIPRRIEVAASKSGPYIESFFRKPAAKSPMKLDEDGALPVLNWPKGISKPTKKVPGESRQEKELRLGLNRAFRTVKAAVIIGPDDAPVMSHWYLLKKKRGRPRSPFWWKRYKNVLPDHSRISDWKKVNFGDSTPVFAPYSEQLTEAYLTSEYADYSAFIASEQKWVNARPKPKTLLGYVVQRLEMEFVPPKQQWRTAQRRLRIWNKLYSAEKFRWLLRNLESEILEYARRGRAVGMPLIYPPLQIEGEFPKAYYRVQLQYAPDYVIRNVKGAVNETGSRGIHRWAFIKDMHIGFWIDPTLREFRAWTPDVQPTHIALSKERWRKIYHFCDPHSPALLEPANVSVAWQNPNGNAHKFFDTLAPSHATSKGVYLYLYKSGRDDRGDETTLGQLYIGRVIERERKRDETTKEWTELSMRVAEESIVKRLRASEYGSQEWLRMTERYYALKKDPLPLIPDGLEGTAWECDGDGKYVQQLVGDTGEHVLQRKGELPDDSGTSVPPNEGWDDVESYTPPHAYIAE